jgi:Polyketide cyclase / dehydrase and lipid transport
LSGRRAGLRTLALGFLVFLSFISLWPCPSVVAATVDSEVLDVKPESGGGVRAVAHVIFPAKPALIQSMLTDYAHWPELFEVRMRLVGLKVQGDVATTDIRIEHALLPGERRLVTESRTLPGGGLVTDLVGGDFKKYHRVWKFTPSNGGTETSADFELLVAIDSIVPDWLVALAMRRELEAHFRIVKEKAIERSKQGR